MNCIKIKLEEKFFQVEERAGYIVDEEKKRLWAVELDLLQEFFRVCKENNIEAYAFAGTLLGAIRHEGFIPWDDDIDICMTRENYNKLERIAEEVFRYPYFFQTARNDTHFFSNTPRLRNSETTGVIPWEYSPNYNGGIFLDCFIMDAVPENDFLFKLQRKELLILQELLRAYMLCPIVKLPVPRSFSAAVLQASTMSLGSAIISPSVSSALTVYLRQGEAFLR